MRTRQRLVLDALIACGLIAAYRPTWTGITLHEWVGVAIVLPLAIHLIVNWEWVLRIARTFFDRLFHASRANFVVDSGLLVSSVAVMLSGIMVSPIPAFFGAVPAQIALWQQLHALSANAIIGLFLVHAVLHRRWIASTVKRLFADRAAGAGARAVPSPVPVVARASANRALTAAQSRRAFRLAAEKAAARRNASVAGVLGVSVALASLIFASVAVAGPMFAKSTAPADATSVPTRTAPSAGRAAAAAATTSGTAATSTSRSAPSAAARAPKAAASAPAAPAAAKQYCPRTGCAAYSCHGAAGANPRTWYQTHN